MPFELDFDTMIKLVSPILVAIVGAVAKRIIDGRPRLIMYLVHASEHPLPPPAPAPALAAPPAARIEGPAAQNQPPPQADPPAPVPAQGPRFAHSHAIVVKNTGKKSAHNVRIDHEIFPFSYRVMPPLNHTVTYGQGASAEIRIPVLVPNEQVTISYLYFPPLTWHMVNAWVKSDEGMAKVIQTIPTSPPPRAVAWLFWFVLFIGASTIVYWLLNLLPIVLR